MTGVHRIKDGECAVGGAGGIITAVAGVSVAVGIFAKHRPYGGMVLVPDGGRADALIGGLMQCLLSLSHPTTGLEWNAKIVGGAGVEGMLILEGIERVLRTWAIPVTARETRIREACEVIFYASGGRLRYARDQHAVEDIARQPTQQRFRANDLKTGRELLSRVLSQEPGHGTGGFAAVAADALFRSHGMKTIRTSDLQAHRQSTSGQPETFVLAIGASTGGTEAIKEVLLALAAEPPPTVIVQHIPGHFSKAFADRLNELCPFEVKEAVDGDRLLSGHVLIAPGGRQTKVESSAEGLRIHITDDPAVNHHKPSVDVLFDSVAKSLHADALGVILTGMGSDGAAGLLAMKNAGALTLAQNEASCIVYGMPREAIRLGAAVRTGDLAFIAKTIDAWSHSKRYLR